MWEYKPANVDYSVFYLQLNQMAEEGWELVQVLEVPLPPIAIWKRKIKSD